MGIFAFSIDLSVSSQRVFNEGHTMKATISMESLWQTISSLSLNNRNGWQRS